MIRRMNSADGASEETLTAIRGQKKELCIVLCRVEEAEVFRKRRFTMRFS